MLGDDANRRGQEVVTQIPAQKSRWQATEEVGVIEWKNRMEPDQAHS